MAEAVSEEDDLADLQRWLQAAMLAPEGLPHDVDRVLTGSSRMRAGERLAVYWRGYRLRLLEAMRGLYPALCELLGQELFDRFALDYLDTHPPGSYSLLRLNDRFPGHLAGTRPDEPWADLVVDLAGFEQIFNEILDGPGAEDREAVDLTALVPDGRDWPDVVLVPTPSLRLVPARFPVHEYAAAVHRGEQPPLPLARKAFLAIARRDYRVLTRELGASAYRALHALAHGGTVRAVLGGTEPEVAAEWLRDWTAARFFTSVLRPSPMQ